jgi:hypothetical protein
MKTKEQDKKIAAFVDPRAPRRILSASEGEALSRRLSAPARKPTQAMVDAIRTHKRLLSETSAR